MFRPRAFALATGFAAIAAVASAPVGRAAPAPVPVQPAGPAGANSVPSPPPPLPPLPPAGAVRVPQGADLDRRYGIAAIAPSRTSIYIGSVSLTVDPLVLRAGSYESKYVASVFPYFFYNEKGSFAIAMPEESLLRVSRSEPVEFTGRAVSSDGEERRISGRAVPSDATHGRIKVRIYVSKRIALIFNTTYEIRPQAQ